MKTKATFTFIATAFLLPLINFSQNVEKINFDPKDSASGYYLAVQPQSKMIKAAIVLFTSFLPPESLLPETKLHNTASANDILTIVVSSKQKLYADTASLHRIKLILKDVVTRFSVDPNKFALGGFDEAGNIILRYTELTYENPQEYLVQPKAVFGIETPVDLFGLWHWAERQIKKNYWQGAVGDAKYYIDVMTKENGTIYNNPEVYKKLSPFDRNQATTGNEKWLEKIPVRLYYDTDIEWHLKNRRNSFYDTKMADGSELINRLLLAGNNSAEFVASKQAGWRSNGTRHPNSISIVNEVDCISWVKKCLEIFDPVSWVAPYYFGIPAGWTTEHFPLPPEFAPQIKYKGVEDIRFAPGWGEAKSDEHWTYSFLWWLEGTPKIDAATLQSYLKAYYEGLVSRNIADVPANKLVPTIANVKKINTVTGDLETFNGSISMLDYHTRQPMLLNYLIHVKACRDQKHTPVYFEISPKPITHPVWKKMKEIGDSFKCEN